MSCTRSKVARQDGRGTVSVANEMSAPAVQRPMVQSWLWAVLALMDGRCPPFSVLIVLTRGHSIGNYFATRRTEANSPPAGFATLVRSRISKGVEYALSASPIALLRRIQAPLQIRFGLPRAPRRARSGRCKRARTSIAEQRFRCIPHG